MCQPKGSNGEFTAAEIAEVLSEDFVELAVTMGAIDLTSPERVYEDTKRIMDKLSESVSEKAKTVAERKLK